MTALGNYSKTKVHPSLNKLDIFYSYQPQPPPLFGNRLPNGRIQICRPGPHRLRKERRYFTGLTLIIHEADALAKANYGGVQADAT
jgi:hypothetical protein